MKGDLRIFYFFEGAKDVLHFCRPAGSPGRPMARRGSAKSTQETHPIAPSLCRRHNTEDEVEVHQTLALQWFSGRFPGDPAQVVERYGSRGTIHMRTLRTKKTSLSSVSCHITPHQGALGTIVKYIQITALQCLTLIRTN